MWWWHQHCTSNMPDATKHHLSTVLVLKRNTGNVLGSGSIGYVTDAYRICCLVLPIYFFSVEAGISCANRTRAYFCPNKFQFSRDSNLGWSKSEKSHTISMIEERSLKKEFSDKP